MTNLVKIKMFFRSVEFRFNELKLYILNKDYRKELKKNNESIFVKGGK
ncbi:hypothetical protein [Aliarcobacter cibarius]|nr:hypothetical protein [Aliarcobacter cibarius]